MIYENVSYEIGVWEIEEFESWLEYTSFQSYSTKNIIYLFEWSTREGYITIHDWLMRTMYHKIISQKLNPFIPAAIFKMTNLTMIAWFFSLEAGGTEFYGKFPFRINLPLNSTPSCPQDFFPENVAKTDSGLFGL